MSTLIEMGYMLSIFSFLGGLKFMSSPKKAKQGNMLAAAGMILVVALTFYVGLTETVPYINLTIIFLAIVLGTILGKSISNKVEMTKMPQLISLFNATGGGCALILGIIESQFDASTSGLGNQITLIVGLLTGAVAFSGSIVAERKLSGKIKEYKTKAAILFGRSVLLVIVLLPFLYFSGVLPIGFPAFIFAVAGLSLLYGVLFVLPIGGADMPVVISLLNAITGVATACAGIVYNNKVMIAGGIFVSAAGLFLTILMCRAMNRSLLKVLTGTFKKGNKSSSAEAEQVVRELSIPEMVMQLSFAKKVAIVPGYGLAVAQAQHACAQFQHLLEERETEVHYIIHPVAGRMPGHMNVLLAEAKVDYSNLKEMDEVNDEMDTYDFVLVIGANDVVNPMAETDEDSAVYGMPIIRAYRGKQVVVIKRSMNTGYAGVSNRLFEMENCALLFGDAKDSLQQIIGQLKMI
ncbi:MAG TPA: NAD(P)(+) transhydrogenase (Re/Si-specific) subunit beta [Flavobacteriaceae bacterium]|nr:NAD(P)(+) transhydrogenase (Re/Si-specific) subunit beta [Flavobacteriaceae bacterium]